MDFGDDQGYYAYLRSGFIDGDFDFINEDHFWHFDQVMDTGYTANFWFLGPGIIWLPFFLLGHGIAWVYQALGYPVSLDGYSFPYTSLTFLGSALEVFLALLICHKLLNKYYSATLSWFTTVFTFSATCLPYFSFIRNRMSHSSDLLFSFLFLGLFFKFRENKNQALPYFILWGICAGMLFNFRYSNLVYLIFPLGLLIQAYYESSSISFSKLRNVLYGATAFIITTLPQWCAWLQLNGKPAPSTSGMAVQLSPSFESFFNAVTRFFFKADWGLLWNEPIWLIALVGWIHMLKKDRLTSILCLAVFFSGCVVPLTLGNGAAFGQRYLIALMPLLALGLAHFMEGIKTPLGKKAIIISGTLFSIWIYFLTINYKVTLQHDAQSFPIQSIRNLPFILENGYLFRPTTYLNLWMDDKWQLQDFLDAYFLIIFPLLFLILSWCALWGFNRLKTVLISSDKTNAFLTRGAIGILATLIGLSIWIVTANPPLPNAIKKERFQIAAVSALAKDKNKKGFTKYLEKSLALGGQNEKDYLLQGDTQLMKGSFKEAEPFYQKAVSLNPRSTALLQLERIDRITQKTPYIHPSQVNQLNEPHWKTQLWSGFYFLDVKIDPHQAIPFFRESLKANPGQKYAEGIKALINQYEKQYERLRKIDKDFKDLPQVYCLILNTFFNSVRLNQMPVGNI